MENYINSPIARQWTDQDIINEYQRCQDKKQVAKIYLISVKEVTEILKRNKYGFMQKQRKSTSIFLCKIRMDMENTQIGNYRR